MKNQEIDFREMSKKMHEMFDRLRVVTNEELMKFTADELRTIHLLYGEDLTYPIYSDIVDTMDGPSNLDLVH